MMPIRTFGLLLAMLLLGACDKPASPPKTPPAPPQAPSVQAPAEPKATDPAPAAEPAAKPSVKPTQAKTVKPFEPLIDSQLSEVPVSKAPVEKNAPAPKEPVTQVRPPQPPDKIQRLQVAKPQTAAQQKASAAVKNAPVPKAKLDLHLPKDMVKQLEPQVSAAPGVSAPAPKAAEPALLPQMFAEKPNEQSSFEMGGRVITNDRSRDQDKDSSYFDTVDGAELQFKFRH